MKSVSYLSIIPASVFILGFIFPQMKLYVCTTETIAIPSYFMNKDPIFCLLVD